MKKFRVIFTDAKTGYDLWQNYLCHSESFAVLAVRLQNIGLSFRLIEEVTKIYQMAQYSFIPTPDDGIPAEAYIKRPEGVNNAALVNGGLHAE